MASSKTFVLVACFAGLFSAAEGISAFRGNSAASLSNVGRLSYDELKAAVMDEVMAALGSDNRLTQQRLESIEQSLRPTFMAMPKNEFGNLDHASARYVMHRLFVQRHAMFIKASSQEEVPGATATPQHQMSCRTEFLTWCKACSKTG